MLVGDALLVARECANRGIAGLSAILALWAVTSNVSLGEIAAWKLGRAVVADANDILAAAGVSARLPVPAEVTPPFTPSPPPPPSQNASGPTAQGALNAFLWGAIIAGLLAAVAAGLYVMAGGKAFGARSPAPARPPYGWAPPPPGFEASGPLQAGAFRQTAPGGGGGCPACGAPLRPGWGSCTACGRPIRWN